ncbi:MAG TPA: hypothetical protein VGF14_00720 [Alphaproteobacteria bacterium]
MKSNKDITQAILFYILVAVAAIISLIAIAMQFLSLMFADSDKELQTGQWITVGVTIIPLIAGIFLCDYIQRKEPDCLRFCVFLTALSPFITSLILYSIFALLM